MEFDDHDEGEEEMELPPTYEQLGNSSTCRVGGGKVGEDVSAGAASRKVVGGTSGGSRYRECLKNHAVNIGGHAVDGCGEFLAAGEEGTLDALKCAACNCHRNFHRKETDGEVYHHQPFSPYYRTPAGYLHVAPHHRPPALALPSTSGGGGGAQSREDQEDISNPSSGGGGIGGGGSGGPSSKKRFRTKFTQEQKDKMLAFAERLGWRIQKHDEAAVQQFCNETCVKRHVLKVWMHNNKHTLGKKP
ncbi:zinc-finger homeodomain protein 1-like [Aristolochia californica]|uniref:zinc-finger homeodomain protein 1-like n=1 Tax=Aristolochia californica TaxID=171875 RepID=UPI0035E332B3